LLLLQDEQGELHLVRMRRADVKALQQVRFADEDILAISEVTA